MGKRKSWQEKMQHPPAPVFKEGPQEWNDRYGGGKMLIPTPMSILEIVKEIPVGHCMAASELREELAFRNGADYTCPLTTGIFLRILAEATEEASQTGSDTLAPWWRVVPDDGKLSLKLPGQGKLQKQRLEAEGWEFVPKGLTWKLIR